VPNATPRYSVEVLSLIINSDAFVLKHEDSVVFRFVYYRANLNIFGGQSIFLEKYGLFGGQSIFLEKYGLFGGQSIFLEKYGLLGKIISVCTLISGISNSVFIGSIKPLIFALF